RTGKHPRGLALLEPVMGEIGALGDDGLSAQAYYCLGQLQAGMGKYKEASSALEEAALRAGRAGDDHQLAEALVVQVGVVGFALNQDERARGLIPAVRAAVARAHDDQLLGYLLANLSTIQHAHHEFAEALASGEQAAALLAGRPERVSLRAT